MRVIILREEHLWVAQCLEHDIAAQSDSLHGVQVEFVKMVAAQIAVALSIKRDPQEFLQSLGQAPDYYHDCFQRAERLENPIRVPDRVEIPPAFMLDPIQRSLADSRIYA